MSYYTYFDLAVGTDHSMNSLKDIEKEKQIYLAFAKIPYFYDDETDEDILSDVADSADVIDQINADFLYIDKKWYDHEIDMCNLSLQFPDLYFKLDCNGEDNTFWREWYHNGTFYDCESHVIYDEPDWDYLEGGNDQTGTCSEN